MWTDHCLNIFAFILKVPSALVVHVQVPVDILMQFSFKFVYAVAELVLKYTVQ
jgi:hypothetical protein